MKPYYESESGKLYHGDCLQIMPQLEPVDLVLTDPPYGMSFQSNHRIKKHKKIINDDSLPIGPILMAIEKAKRAAYIFCRWDFLCELPAPKSFICWVKNNHTMGDLKHEHGRKWEGCCFYPKEGHEFIKRIPDVINCQGAGNNLHPTEKPVGLIQELIQANVCDSILDPFIGSGTTAVAAEQFNKKWIGIEKDEEYCEIAAKRIERETKQMNLIDYVIKTKVSDF